MTLCLLHNFSVIVTVNNYIDTCSYNEISNGRFTLRDLCAYSCSFSCIVYHLPGITNSVLTNMAWMLLWCTAGSIRYWLHEVSLN